MNKKTKEIILNALAEDIGPGDITTEALPHKDQPSRAIILAKDNFLVCGLEIVKFIFQHLDPQAKIKIYFPDKTTVRKGETIMEIYSSAEVLLKGERTALNFLQRMCGISTLTARYAEEIKDYPAKIKDTRKTTPGLRILEKYAVKCGGGVNHRFGLYDAILIKDNHIKIAGSITAAIKNIRKKHPRKKIEVEVCTEEEIREALSLKPDIILFDNMNIRQIKKGVKIVDKKALIEVSGGVNLKTVQKIAQTGVDHISVGNLTHSAKAVDISLEIV